MPSHPAKIAGTAAPLPHLYTEIRAEMVRRGETVASAAAHFCLDRTNINRKLSGRAIFSVADLLGFADWLDVPAADLLARAEVAAKRPAGRPGRAA